jgi:thiol-disulfide isomerase/thioredoxin
MFKTHLATLFCILFLTLTGTATVSAIDIGDSAPNWVLKNAAGSDTDYYRDSANQVAVLIYWATWCPYCKSLMPHLQQAADLYRDQPVRFYAMDINETGDPVRHIKEAGFSFELILDADTTMEAYGVRGTPSVFVIDRNHKVVYRRIPDTSDEAVKVAVQLAIDTALKQ